MSFISLEFVALFIITIGVYYVLPHKYRWILLLAASYSFYMFWKPIYILLLLTSTLVDYYAARMMSETIDKSERKKYLLLSLVTNLGLLAFFKYFGLFESTAADFFGLFGLNYIGTGWNILLPIGISFYTFQTIGYTLDVYRGTIKAEKHIGYFALYVSFFPQLVAGPIERAGNLMPQLRKKFVFNYNQSVDGIFLVCLGFLKKTVIADRLAIIIDKVFDNPQAFAGPQLLFFSALFLYQIFFDFSSYTDIARGTSKLLGIELMENFKRPFAASTISDLWSRWHISLTSWFSNYLSIPIYKKYRKMNKTFAYIFSLVVTLGLCGLWHGASWTFLIWGLYIAVVMIIGNKTRPYRKKIKIALKIDKLPIINRLMEFFTVMITVSIAMVFFRSPDMPFAIDYIKTAFTFQNSSSILSNLLSVGIGMYELSITAAFCIAIEVYQLVLEKTSLIALRTKIKPVIRYAIYIAMILSILILGKFTGSEYIYFQF